MSKHVRIKKGRFRGYRGRVLWVGENDIKVALSGREHPLTVKISDVALPDDTKSRYKVTAHNVVGTPAYDDGGGDMRDGSQTPYFGAPTPMHDPMTPNTPSHFGSATPSDDMAWNPSASYYDADGETTTTDHTTDAGEESSAYSSSWQQTSPDGMSSPGTDVGAASPAFMPTSPSDTPASPAPTSPDSFPSLAPPSPEPPAPAAVDLEPWAVEGVYVVVRESNEQGVIVDVDESTGSCQIRLVGGDEVQTYGQDELEVQGTTEVSEYVYIFEGEHKGTRGRITSAIDKECIVHVYDGTDREVITLDIHMAKTTEPE